MTVYKIAERFPIEARRYAVGLEYRPNNVGERRAKTPGATCPLGACIRSAKLGKSCSPWSGQVASLLGFSQRTNEWLLVADEARVFMADWDNGTIIDLADALGVKS